ncbi:MAG TPA: glycosyltransferase family 2 protein [Gemmatimonadaceae bacterium]|nr:glycosyltransferase family 2 protein [Gemmatimonadaceae bacterium]
MEAGCGARARGTPLTLALLAALPYAVIALVTAIRYRNSKSLDEESETPPPNAPLVSVVIPARNEERNIERCIRSVLSTTYPNVQVIVVDDHSTDRTGDIARRVAAHDPRVTVMLNHPLPDGWFGKQWACDTGARASQGDIILFADADTTQSNDLMARSVNMMLRRSADLFSVAGTQELGSFWEVLIQPQVFTMLAVRYGGTENVTRSRFVSGKIANGQCMFVRRDAYEELGGHSLVRSHVADDMMMAQRFFGRGKNVVLAEGLSQLSTRMYTSLGELVRGWGKNVFAGGIDSIPGGLLGRLFYPLLLLSGPVSGTLPALVIAASAVLQVPRGLLLWAVVSQLILLTWWTFVYRRIGRSPFYALLSPVAAAVVFYIFVRAVLRGRRVTWKDRDYVSA